MNIENNESPDPAVPTENGDTAAASAPKRKPRARKAVETIEAEGVSAEANADEPVAAPADAAPASDAHDGTEVAAKPARAPRKPRATKPKAESEAGQGGDAAPELASPDAAAAAPAVAGSSAPVHAVAATPAERAESRRDDRAAAVDVGNGASNPEAGETDVRPAQEGEGESSTEASAESGAEGSGEAAGEGTGEGRRSRNRRRGRRGGSSNRVEGETEGGEATTAPARAAEGSPERERDADGDASNNAPVPTLPAPDTAEVFASLLSGDFDVEQGEEVALAEPEADDKRVLAPDPDAPKLHKVLAQSGIGSRRDMEQMIQDGRVSVNGETAHIGMRISYGDRIAIDGKPAKVRITPPPPRIIAYHKPTGEVVTHDDPQQRPTVFRRLPRLPQGKWQSVGRLDINTEGLLLFTNSGDLANKLMHPRFGIEREYAVRVLGTLEKEAREKLLAGVSIEGQQANFKSIEDGGGEGVNRWYRVVISEGRNREVRKLFDAVGLTVSRLIRVRYGCVVLPRGLKRGVWVDLNESDVKALRVLTGSQQPQPQPQRNDPRNDARAEPRHDGQNGSRNDSRDSRGGDPRRDNNKGGPRPSQPQQPKRGNEPRPQQSNERSDRGNKPPRDDRRGPRPAQQPYGTANNSNAGDSLPREFREPGDPTRIPNPLQQTFDKRAMQRDRAPNRDDLYENGPIPNPLQQTYDKRFTQPQRGGGFGNPNQPRGGKGGDGPANPDPLQTAVGYIGADAFTRKSQNRGGGGGGGNNRGGRRGGGR